LIRDGFRSSAGASQVVRPGKGWSGRRSVPEIPSQSIHDRTYIYPLTLLQLITKETSKRLVQSLAKKALRDQYSWGQVPVSEKRLAITEVDTALKEEHIIVPEETIRNRLQKSMRDVQRSEHLPEMCCL
jgi:hypothetical protein